MFFSQRILLLALVLFCIQVDFYSAVKINISPKKVAADKDPVANVTCRVDDKETKAATEIMTMKVARKGGRVLVVLYPNSTIDYVEATQEEVTAKGTIENVEDLTKSYLEVGIVEPDTEDAGMYVCEVIYNVTTGESKKSKAHALLVVKAKDVSKMDQQVEDLLSEVKKEESFIKDMEQKEEQVKKLVPDLEKKTENTEKKIKDLLSKENDSQKKVSEIEEKATKQLNLIKELTQKEETEVKSLKESVENLLKKRQKKKDDMKEVSGKEDEAKTKVKTLEEEVEKKTKEIEDLDEKEKQVEKKVNDLQVNSKDALRKVKKFLDNKGAVEKKLKSMENTIVEKGTKLVDLQRKEDEVETKMAALEEKLEQAIIAYNEVESGTDLGQDPGIGSGDTGSDIGSGRDTGVMSAFVATNQQNVLNPKQGTKLVFPDVIMQAGMEGYNLNTGTYTAPVSGLYQFSLTIKLHCSGCYTLVAIMAQGRTIARLRTGTFYDEDQSSVSALAKLTQGSKVFLFNEKIFSKRKPFLTPFRLCVFAGHLVKQIEPQLYGAPGPIKHIDQ